MNDNKLIDRIPGLRQILDKCQDDVNSLVGPGITVHFKIESSRLTTTELCAIVCDVCEVDWNKLLEKNRKAHYVIARHLFCYFAFYTLKMSLTHIAEIFGWDHTSVIHARDKVVDLLSVHDGLYTETAREIEKQINVITARKKKHHEEIEG